MKKILDAKFLERIEKTRQHMILVRWKRIET